MMSGRHRNQTKHSTSCPVTVISRNGNVWYPSVEAVLSDPVFSGLTKGSLYRMINTGRTWTDGYTTFDYSTFDDPSAPPDDCVGDMA
jgi:hypothetical protein